MSDPIYDDVIVTCHWKSGIQKFIKQPQKIQISYGNSRALPCAFTSLKGTHFKKRIQLLNKYLKNLKI